MRQERDLRRGGREQGPIRRSSVKGKGAGGFFRDRGENPGGKRKPFFSDSLFRVKHTPSRKGVRVPTEVDADETLIVALKLARQGYGAGDPRTIMRWPSDLVLAAASYEHFLVDYETAWYDLNKEK